MNRLSKFWRSLLGKTTEQGQTIKPGACASFTLPVPGDVTLDELAKASVRVSFGCGDCGREHEAKVPVAGGKIAVDCPCGAKLRLNVG